MSECICAHVVFDKLKTGLLNTLSLLYVCANFYLQVSSVEKR